MDWPATLTILIPVAVAVLGGLLAILGIKGNIISTARVQWIQDLRGGLCDYVEANERLHIHLLDEIFRQDEQFAFNTLSLLTVVNKHGNRITLFLNRSEKKHEELIVAIERLETELEQYVKRDYEAPDDDNVDALKKQVLAKAGVVLKDAWDDAKSFRILELLRFRL